MTDPVYAATYLGTFFAGMGTGWITTLMAARRRDKQESK